MDAADRITWFASASDPLSLGISLARLMTATARALDFCQTVSARNDVCPDIRPPCSMHYALCPMHCLHDRRDALAAADAHGFEAVAGAAALHFVGEGGHDAAAGGADGVADAD